MRNVGRIGASVLAVLLVVAAAVGVGMGIYQANDTRQPDNFSTGAADATDRVSIIAAIEKVDPAQYSVTLRVWAVPHGRFTSDDGRTAARDIQVLSTGLSGTSLTLQAGRRIGAQTIPVEVDRGDVSRYPFDRYSADVYFSATVDGRNVPVDLTVENSDALFTLNASAHPDDIEPGLHVQLSRSPGTFIVVGLMFVVMWTLALAVTAAASVIVRNRLGLVWPALAWMAATLFALTAFRGTAPGNPPIGCILDYTAFLWAQAIVACSLVYVVVRGVPLEWAKSVPEP
ncbi:MAG: DUF4436 family protein [Mycobacterium sp.]